MQKPNNSYRKSAFDVRFITENGNLRYYIMFMNAL